MCGAVPYGAYTPLHLVNGEEAWLRAQEQLAADAQREMRFRESGGIEGEFREVDPAAPRMIEGPK